MFHRNLKYPRNLNDSFQKNGSVLKPKQTIVELLNSNVDGKITSEKSIDNTFLGLAKISVEQKKVVFFKYKECLFYF